MNIPVRQDPWSVMPRLQDEINRLFGNAQQTDSSSSATATWVPAVDIHEYANRFELYVDVPRGRSELRRIDVRRRRSDAVGRTSCERFDQRGGSAPVSAHRAQSGAVLWAFCSAGYCG